MRSAIGEITIRAFNTTKPERKLLPKAIIKEGKVFSGRATEADVETWAKSQKK